MAVLGKEKVSKDSGSHTFCITWSTSNLIFVILSLKNEANPSHFDTEMTKEWLFGGGLIDLSIVERENNSVFMIIFRNEGVLHF